MLAGPAKKVFGQTGDLRLHMAREMGLMPEGADGPWDFLWVTDFPLFEYDEADGRFYAMHHPFTSPRPEDVPLLDTDPGAARARAYDLVLNGSEIGGGSIRIHRPDVQRRMFSLLGISDEEAEARFGFLLDAFRFGAPPHGGIALGILAAPGHRTRIHRRRVGSSLGRCRACRRLPGVRGRPLDLLRGRVQKPGRACREEWNRPRRGHRSGGAPGRSGAGR